MPCGFFSCSSLPIEVPTPSESAVRRRGESTASLQTRPSTISASTVWRENMTASFRAGIPSGPMTVVSRTTLHFCRVESMLVPMRRSPMPSSVMSSSPHDAAVARVPGAEGEDTTADDDAAEREDESTVELFRDSQAISASISTRRRTSTSGWRVTVTRCHGLPSPGSSRRRAEFHPFDESVEAWLAAE